MFRRTTDFDWIREQTNIESLNLKITRTAEIAPDRPLIHVFFGKYVGCNDLRPGLNQVYGSTIFA